MGASELKNPLSFVLQGGSEAEEEHRLRQGFEKIRTFALGKNLRSITFMHGRLCTECLGTTNDVQGLLCAKSFRRQR